MSPFPDVAFTPAGERARWLTRADRLLDGARVFASPGHGRITLPGREGGYGRAVDGLEGFARTFLLAAFRLAGDEGRGLDALAEFYRRGVETGTDPNADDRWVRLDEHPQAKVEAASIALALDMTRPWIWDRLGTGTRERVIAYLSPVVGDDTYPKTNWLWFRLVVETFLRSVDGPWSKADVLTDLALHDSLAREGGWMSDGVTRAFDHYSGWALQIYPVLWSRMLGAADFASERRGSDLDRLDQYLGDAVALIGGDGSPLLQGRSLIYRFAAAAPFWAGVFAEVPSIPLGLLRHAADRVVVHFEANGAPDDSGVLTMGWHREWRQLAQSYSGPGSPYWAVKGLMGVALPADHPVWAAVAIPLPVERGDTLRALAAPGWLVSGTSRDGIVRVVNHGTDHASEGDLSGDSPLYAELGYSTATSPLLDSDAWERPLEQAVAIVDADGRATHRSGMSALGVRVEGTGASAVGIGGSSWDAHFLAPGSDQALHGSGLEGEGQVVGRITTVSAVRGSHEVRMVRVDALAEGHLGGDLTIRMGGWPLSGTGPAWTATHGTAVVNSGMRISRIEALVGAGTAQCELRPDADPLGAVAAVPYLTFPLVTGEWRIAALTLGGAPSDGTVRVRLSNRDHGESNTAEISWPDDVVTRCILPTPGRDNGPVAKSGPNVGPVTHPQQGAQR